MAEDSWQSAWVEVVPDFTNFRKDANSQMTRILGDAGDDSGVVSGKRFSSGFGAVFGGSFFGSLFANFSRDIGLAIGTGIRTGFDFLSDSVSLGSDLNESTNAIKVAYGDAFGEIEKLGKGSDKRLGLSNLDFNEIATQFSSFAGTIKKDNPAGFIDELSQRGADFASVYNIDVAEALQLFQSGLAGENEPLRKYGVDLSAASVNAYAFANGIGTAGQELSEAQKQQARYGLLLAQTDKVQGDFKNTSGELANSQRIFQATLQDTQAKLGAYLLPALTNILAIGNDKLLPMFGDLVEKVGPQLADALVKVTPSLVDFVEAIVPHIPALIELGTSAIPPIVEAFIVLSPLLIDVAYNTSAAFSAMSTFFGFLSGNVTLQEFGQQLADNKGSLSDLSNGVISFVQTAAQSFRDFANGVGTSIGNVITFVRGLPGQIIGAISGFGSILYSSGKSLIQGFLDGINSMFGQISKTVGGVMDFVASFFPHSPAERGQFSGSGWTQVSRSGEALFAQFTGGFQSGVPANLTSGVSVSGIGSSLVGIGGSPFSTGSAVTVHQTITTTEADPRLVARGIGREFTRAMAGA